MKYVEGLRAFPLLSNMADNELGILAEALSESSPPQERISSRRVNQAMNCLS